MIEISDSDVARLRRLAAKYTDDAWTDQYAHGGGISWATGYALVEELDRVLTRRAPEPAPARSLATPKEQQ